MKSFLLEFVERIKMFEGHHNKEYPIGIPRQEGIPCLNYKFLVNVDILEARVHNDSPPSLSGRLDEMYFVRLKRRLLNYLETTSLRYETSL